MLPVAAQLFQAPVGSRSERAVRDDCLRVLIPGLAELAVGRIVVESCGQDRADNQVIRDAVSKLADGQRPAYLHTSPAAEPLLWLPDIVGWAYGRGGDWRRRVAAVVADVVRVEP